jgi:flagellar L-ring protein precursor FlgH
MSKIIFSNGNKKILSIAILSLLATGCLKDPKPGDKAFAPTYPSMPDIGKTSQNGSIYNSQTALSLYESPIARRVGDVLTIKLVENTQALKRAENRSQKDNTTDIPNPTILGKSVSLGGLGPGYNLGFTNDAEREFQARAESRQNNTLTGSISVTVHKVLANGSLLVQGEKWVEINTGNEYIRLSGIVRPQDIQPDNTITSDKVANARIGYSGTGQNHEDQKMGWLSKFLWSSLFLF